MSHKLTPKQMKAVHLLASGEKATVIARELKLRRETLSRWKRLPEFMAEIDKVMAETQERMRYRLLQLAEASISAMRMEVSSGDGDPKRVVAAMNVLKLLGMERLALPDAVDNDANSGKKS